MLQDDETVVEGSWNNKPSGCFFGPEIHYNTNSEASYFIKSAQFNTFLRFNSNRDVDLSTNTSSSEEIILEKLDGDMYAIKSVTHANMYLRFGGSGASKVVNTQTYPGPWERFYIEKLDNGKVAFKNVQFGNYLRAWGNGHLDTQTFIGAWEQFELIKIN